MEDNSVICNSMISTKIIPFSYFHCVFHGQLSDRHIVILLVRMTLVVETYRAYSSGYSPHGLPKYV